MDCELLWEPFLVGKMLYQSVNLSICLSMHAYIEVNLIEFSGPYSQINVYSIRLQLQLMPFRNCKTDFTALMSVEKWNRGACSLLPLWHRPLLSCLYLWLCYFSSRFPFHIVCSATSLPTNAAVASVCSLIGCKWENAQILIIFSRHGWKCGQHESQDGSLAGWPWTSHLFLLASVIS